MGENNFYFVFVFIKSKLSFLLKSITYFSNREQISKTNLAKTFLYFEAFFLKPNELSKIFKNGPFES
jgi:hypothetical protein